jgi:2,3-bisphosphoglycerate-independent phosphoglycerate mutase
MSGSPGPAPGAGSVPGRPPVARVCLVVLDGWGLAEPGPGNAVSLAHTPVFDELWATCPHTTLQACGRAVGLPDGQMGNSEVGHLNLGAGAVVRQDLVRIDDAIADGSFAANPVLRAALQDVDRVHLIGLVSDGGVHSSLEHLLALIACAREPPAASAGERKDVIVHAFTDGRDTLPHAGADFLAKLDATAGARVGSVVGRYWAMDRDRRWDRTQRAYDLLIHGCAPRSACSGEQAVRSAYERGETDEFVEPTVVGADTAIKPGDSVIAFNFRPDRMRQITRALAEPGFGDGGGANGGAQARGEAIGVVVAGVDGGGGGEQLPGWTGRGGAEPVKRYATLAEYEEGWPYPVAFTPERPATTLAATIAGTGARQLHVAETEKYAHVTYFFNGGVEIQQAGEQRELAPSRRDVPTYDHAPEMSAAQAADAFVRAWREEEPEFGIINFANADMVGHTGVIAAAVRAVETVDECLGRVLSAVRETGGVCVITADHGNADHMLEPDGSPNTAHSLNPVPLIVTVREDDDGTLALRADGGILADVAPTVLELLGIDQPAAMTGCSLIETGIAAVGGCLPASVERT